MYRKSERMKNIIPIAVLSCISLSVSSQVRNSYVIKNQPVTDQPVNKLLYGNFIELGFGRSENAWSDYGRMCLSQRESRIAESHP